MRKGLTYKRDGKLNELDSESIIRSCVLAKMDRSVQEKWVSKVVRSREKKMKELDFADVVKFIEHQLLLASDPSYSQSVYKDDLAIPGMKNFATQCQVTFAKCFLCDGEHSLDQCPSFIDMKLDQRAKFIYHNRLCFACFESISDDHLAKTCKKKKICEICKESHPTLIHGYIPKLRSYSIHQTSKETISMSIVPVRLSHQSDETRELKVYALLDENSQGTFIHEALLDKLPVIKRCTSITTETINGFNTDSSFAIDGLVVKPLKEFENAYYPVKIPLPTSYSREVISCHGEEVPTTERIKKWSHLQSIFNKLPDYDPSILLGIIIGANCPKAL